MNLVIGVNMLFPAKINVIFGISTSNNAGISKIYAKKHEAFNSYRFIGISGISDVTLIVGDLTSLLGTGEAFGGRFRQYISQPLYIWSRDLF